MWSDPDIGSATNDFVGCDTLLGLGFGYNASDTDPIYDPLPPPAIGFDLIRGPLVPGNPGEDRNRNGIDDVYDYGFTEDNKMRTGLFNLPMTAFYYFTNQDPLITDPPQGSPEGATQFYNFMKGKIGLTGEYFLNPLTNLPTTFALPGDPVTGTGWIDGIQQGPGDRRLGISTGSIQMAPGDTQVVVIAEIAGGAVAGVSYLDAITLIKTYSQIAQEFYDSAFPLPVSLNDNKVLPLKFELIPKLPQPIQSLNENKILIPQTSKVVIKVFDVLGNEIETLVDEEKPAGTYELTWYAEGLPSRNLLLSISANEFVETKKMLMIK